MQKPKKVVIVGGGFGGLSLALGLERALGRDRSFEVTLIDRRSYHLFTPNLFEVAAAEEELATLESLKRSVTLPYQEVLKGRRIQFIQGEVTAIDRREKLVTAGTRHYPYDCLVVAPGSEPDYCGIPGAREFSLPLKDLRQAFRIKNQLEAAIQVHRHDPVKKSLKVVVVGGGYAGVELAGELADTLKIIAWKNGYPGHKIELELLEAANQLMPGFDDRLSRDAFVRLTDLGVRVRLLCAIRRVDAHFLDLASGERASYDALIWTAGVRARPLPFLDPPGTDRKGRLVTTDFLRLEDDSSVFALGDAALVVDRTGRVVPPSAQDAWHQARYLAYAIPLLLANRRPWPYRPDRHGFIVNVGARYALMSYKGWYLTGFLAYLADIVGHLDYYRTLVGWLKALRYVLFQFRLYQRNN